MDTTADESGSPRQVALTEGLGVWREASADDTMRHPEEGDLIGGATDMPDAPTVVWGVPALLQKAAFEKHCTGDCGKISMGGVIDDPMTGGLFVCCQAQCPHERGVLENYGSTNSFGRPHIVHLRALNEDA